MYAEAIVALIVGTVAVLLVPALVLAGSVPGNIKRRRTAGRH